MLVFLLKTKMDKLSAWMRHFCSGTCPTSFPVTSSPSQEEGDVESWAVEIDELKEEHLEGEAVLPLWLCPRLLCGGTEGKGGTLRHTNTQWDPDSGVPSQKHADMMHS